MMYMYKENIQQHIGIVPSQYTGKEIEARATRCFEDEMEASGFFELSKSRLLDVNNWNKIAGIVTAEFQVIDENGHEVKRGVRKGDYLRINIPGPGSSEGDGYDWVHVEELKEINESSIHSIGFRVRPADNPFSKKNETAHFYSAEATSSFIITQDNNEITSLIIDRNLQPNTESQSIVDKVRDAVVGASAIAGFSKLQWQGLAEGLIANTDSSAR